MKTIIVIGAGASSDFCRNNKEGLPSIGMPTGEKLIEQMVNFEEDLLRFGFRSYIQRMIRKLAFCRADGNVAEKLSTKIIGVGRYGYDQGEHGRIVREIQECERAGYIMVDGSNEAIIEELRAEHLSPGQRKNYVLEKIAK